MSPSDRRIVTIQDRIGGRRPATFEAWMPALIRLQCTMGACRYGMNGHEDLAEPGNEDAGRAVDRACRRSINVFIDSLMRGGT